MSDFFSTNLAYLRESRKESQEKAASALGLTRSTLANYEAGDNFPKLDIVLKMLEHYEVSFEDLTQKAISDVHPIVKKADKKNTASVHPIVHPTVHPNKKNDVILAPMASDNTEASNVYDLDSKAAAGIAQIMSSKDKLSQLPTLYYPNLGFGVHVRMQITGDSMGRTVKDGDHVIATLLQSGVQELRQGYVHVVLDREEGLVCKRVYHSGKSELELVSDNESYAPYKRHLNDVLMLFKVVEVHSRDLSNYQGFDRTEISKIWKEIDTLKKRFKSA